MGLDGTVVWIDGFGTIAPAEVLYEKFGITAEAVVAQAKSLLRR